MSFSDIILSLDIYGKNPVMRIGNKSSMKTYLGSILSILTFLFGLTLFIYFGLQAILKQNPKINLSIKSVESPAPVYFSQKNFSFALGLQNPTTYNQYIDESIYTVSATLNIGKRKIVNGTSAFDWEITNLDLINCDISHFPNEYKSSFKSFPLDSMYCIKNVSYALFGTFVNEAYSFIKFNLYECVNSTKNNFSCKTKEKIDKVLGGAFFGFFFTDISIDPLNFTTPNQISVGDSYTTVSNKVYTEIHHYMKPIQISSDYGLVFEDIHTDYYLQKERLLIMNNFQPSVNFVSYTLKLSTELDIYKRSYTKVQDVAAQIGGMLNFLTTCGFILSYFYTEVKYNELLINQSYDYGREKNEATKSGKILKLTKIIEKHKDNLNFQNHELNSNINLNINAEISHVKLLNRSSVGDISELDKEKVNIINVLCLEQNSDLRSRNDLMKVIAPEKGKISILEFLKKKKFSTKLNFSVWESVKIFFCYYCTRDQKKIKFMADTTDLIDKKLDMIELLHCFDQVERIKFLMMDEMQIILFDNLPKKLFRDYILMEQKPEFNQNRKMKKSSKLQRYQTQVDFGKNKEECNDKEIVNAFKHVKDKIKVNNFTCIDKKLYELFDE